MQDTSGFYKIDNGNLLHGSEFVLNKNYELRRATKDQHIYPIDGWHWFDSVSKANVFFGLPNIEPPTEET